MRSGSCSSTSSVICVELTTELCISGLQVSTCMEGNNHHIHGVCGRLVRLVPVYCLLHNIQVSAIPNWTELIHVVKLSNQ